MKLCIFDLDGTLTDTLSTIAYYGNAALTACGLPEIAVRDYKMLVGDGRDALIHRMLKKFDMDTQELFNKACGVYDRAYEAEVMYKTSVYEGIHEAISGLKKRGIIVTVLSNKPDNVVRMIVDKLFKDEFSAVYGQRESVRKKPDPEGAVMLAEEFGVPVCDCLFIGDTNVDIKTGRAAGMRTAGVLWGFRDEKELRDAGADYIVSKPVDLIKIEF